MVMRPDDPRVDRLRRGVVERFGVPESSVRVVRAPYRICPLGAHIDHQLGPVTAMALDQSVLLAFAPSGGPEVRLASLDFPGEVAFSIDAIVDRRPGDWGNYPRGAVRALRRDYKVSQGMIGVIAGQLHGGGVSSSAAVGVAYLLALESVNNVEISPEENIALDLAIENEYLGLKIGILDQSAILLSRRGCLTWIDCRTSGHEVIPPASAMPPFRVLLAFSGLRKALVGTDYNRRVEECAEAARILLTQAGRTGDRPVLGNLTDAEYARSRTLLAGPPARRAAHFFEERKRVAQGVEAWRAGDLREFGRLMNRSGESSIHLYECGSPPLITLYDLLIQEPAVYGARFSGAGFRGCCVALIEPGAAEAVGERVLARYRSRHPDLAGDASVVVCETDDAAAILAKE